MRLALRLAFLWIALLCLLQIVSVSAQESGYTYTVQPGDSWPLVAQRFGLTVSELQVANPDAVRANGWLIIGELLFIPRAPDWEEKFYIVQRGDGWTTVAERFGLTVELLQGANPKAQGEDDSLIVGERLLIPALLPTPTEAPTDRLSPTVTPTPVLDLLAILSSDSDSAPFFVPHISVPLPTRGDTAPMPGRARRPGAGADRPFPHSHIQPARSTYLFSGGLRSRVSHFGQRRSQRRSRG